MTTTNLTPQQIANRAGAQEAANLANEGKARCRYCKKVVPLGETVAVFFRGNLLFCACPECFEKSPIVLKREIYKGKKCVYAGPLREEDRPSDLVVCSSMRQVDQVAKAVVKPRKVL
jgi:hypothetical protein